MSRVLSNGEVGAAALRLGGADFNRARTHRHLLWRRWAEGPRVLWVCLNPSTAGAFGKEDASTRKIRGFSERWGFGFYMLANLFDYCSTNPRALYDDRMASAFCTPTNFSQIVAAARNSRFVVCAWGRHGNLRGQARRFLDFMDERSAADKLRVIKLNMDGTPAHPLMLPYGLETIPYKEAMWPRK